MNAARPCPACRRRFEANTGADATTCARCGADLKLLNQLINRSKNIIASSLMKTDSTPEHLIKQINAAQKICFDPTARDLLSMLQASNNQRS